MKKMYVILTVLVALSLALTACGPKAQSPAPAPIPVSVAPTTDDWCNGKEYVKVLYQHTDGTMETAKHDDLLVVTAWWYNPEAKLAFKWGKSRFSAPASAQSFNVGYNLVGDDAEVFMNENKIEKTDDEYRNAGSGGIYICYSVP